MQNTNHTNNENKQVVLVTGATGKTGRRIVGLLNEKDVEVRAASRSSEMPFDWFDPESWDANLNGVDAVYITFAPDLAVPGAKQIITDFVEAAKKKGVKRLVILSGRGEEEAQACEKIVQESGLEWTVVRASWFNQNFSEGAFVEMVQNGQITLPNGSIKEPFVDVDDIAAVAAAALTEHGHDGEVYEVTGPRLMTFNEIAEELSKATSRNVEFIEIPHEAFVEGTKQSGAPEQVVWLMDYLFSTVLDGRNAYLTDGVERALGRKPRDFGEYARKVANEGVWKTEQAAE